jgi:hypothetical protein
MDSVHREGDDPAAIVAGGRAEDRQARDLRDPLEGVGGQVGLRGVNAGQTQLLQPPDGGAEADRLADRRRPRTWPADPPR